MPEKIVFILSTSRTGTKALAEGLQGGDILSPHQPPFSRLLTVAGNYHLHGWLSKQMLARMVRLTRGAQIRNADCRFYVQVFSLDYLPAKIISEQVENVHIVHLVRDPRSFVRSYMNWTHTRFKSFVANKFVPGWHPSGFFTGEMDWKTWRRMDEFQRVCWHWTYKNTLLQNLFESHPNYQRARFEDIFLSQNSTALKGILEFIGIPYEERFEAIMGKSKNESVKTYLSHWGDWEPEKRKQLLDICGDKMKEYGYHA